PVAAPGLGTFAVDGSWRLYMDPDLLVGPGRWDSTTVGAVPLHEAGHLLRDHAGRAAALPTPRGHLAWNLAGHADINDDLPAARPRTAWSPRPRSAARTATSRRPTTPTWSRPAPRPRTCPTTARPGAAPAPAARPRPANCPQASRSGTAPPRPWTRQRATSCA